MEIFLSVLSVFLAGLAAYWGYRSLQVAKESKKVAITGLELSQSANSIALESAMISKKEQELRTRERIEQELVERFKLSRDTYSHQQSIQWAIENGIKDQERLRQLIFRTAYSGDIEKDRQDALLGATIHIRECVEGTIKYPHS